MKSDDVSGIYGDLSRAHPVCCIEIHSVRLVHEYPHCFRPRVFRGLESEKEKAVYPTEMLIANCYEQSFNRFQWL